MAQAGRPYLPAPRQRSFMDRAGGAALEPSSSGKPRFVNGVIPALELSRINF